MSTHFLFLRYAHRRSCCSLAIRDKFVIICMRRPIQWPLLRHTRIMICIEDLRWKSIFLANVRRDRFESELAPATLNRPVCSKCEFVCVRAFQSIDLSVLPIAQFEVVDALCCRLAAWHRPPMVINPFADDVRNLSDGALSFNHRSSDGIGCWLTI